jgi:glutaminyl-tRNA synthetase
MRDPIIYRIKIATHHRTGDKWCIYPMYDFAHGQSDSIEQITHSICTLEFVPHRELYDWCIESLEIFPSKQYEFARLNLSYAITSKRKLLKLVTDNFVNGWDDPRMPTISGMRRRGYTAQAIREFCDRIGIAKRDNLIDVSLLEFCVREHLNKIATRVMAVLDPIKIVITNYPEGQVEELNAENNPEDIESGSRIMPFSREILIEKDDFMENPMKKYFRLGPGLMVRLKNAYIIKCDEIVKDDNGEIIELHCSYIENSRSGNDTSGINVKGTIHWVSEAQAVDAEVRIYDRLFMVEDPSREDGDFKEYLNSESLQVIKAKVEPSLKNAKLNTPYQFLRKGYFCLDPDSTADKLVLNKTVGLKDTWAREAGK